jgi:DNA polymerase-3 subunit delta
VSWPTKKRLDGLSYNELSSQIKQGRVEPLYLFVGEEAYLHQRALERLYKTVDESARLLNVSVHSLAESGSSSRERSPAGALIDTANQMPMMATRRIVVARDIDKIKEDDASIICKYLERPSPTTTLVFQAASVDRRKKITETLLDKCTVVVFDPPSDKDLVKWIEGYLKRYGSKIESKARTRLIERTGPGLMRLANELDKLAAYAADGAITEAAVDELVPRTREHSNFELWDVVLAQDRKRALRLLHRLLDDGAEPVMLVGALAGLFRRVLTVKELLDRGARRDEVTKATGQYGQRATAFVTRVSRMPREQVVGAMVRISEVDNAVKNSEATPRLQLEYLLAELTQ